MSGAIWIVGEASGSALARASAEVATLARVLGGSSGRPVVGVVAGDGGPVSASVAADLAGYVPRVLTVDVPAASDTAFAAAVAPSLAALIAREEPSFVLVAATPDGRDLAGMLSALLGWGVLVNAGAVTWVDGSLEVETSVFGGRLITTSAFTSDRGIVTVRPNSLAAERADATGAVENVPPASVGLPFATVSPPVSVVGRIDETTTAAPIEEARIIVAGGRGVGGPEGFRVIEDLAAALGGAVGATRAAVDAGWIPYSQQIGQTGKIVKPRLYLALGISGAIQHKVGMQTAETIVAVNRDPDAPIVEFADVAVIGDLFEVGPAIAAELRSRTA